LDDDNIDEVARIAKKNKANLIRESIPQCDIDRFKEYHDRAVKGQKLTLYFDPSITLNVIVNSQHEFGEVAEYKFIAEDDNFNLAELLNEVLNDYLWDDPSGVLGSLARPIRDAMEEETRAHGRMEAEYFRFKEAHGVNPYDLIDEE